MHAMLLVVPNCYGKHAFESGECFYTPFHKCVEDDFGIRMSLVSVSLGGQNLPYFTEVIDFTIVNYDVPAV